ncbi:alpha-L-fucosidase [Bacteroides sp. UBA939]|uniref:alpha-L-fucosidase n=1 Tax=Bacteroides sp. UBA939 TaxID=1946092 RepID=UPI0025C0407B|nr:alpha-L-fucosidase [Bacteroides sp. UBA939]
MKKPIVAALCSFFLFSPAYAQHQEPEFENTIKVETTDTNEMIIEKAAHIIPTPNQLAALQNEFIAFIHFGPNTYTRMEWGNGMEDPKVFDLKKLDTDQWCEAMKAAGMKMVVLTAKHHDGFVLWQSRYTKHGVMSSNFEGGKGDVMKNLSASCRKYGLKLGVYLSPADLYQIEHPDGLYGNLSLYTERTIPREVPGRPFANQTKFKFVVDDYNEYFLNQLFEVLTEYGPVHEVWFDGAHPKTKGGQKYNYAAWRELIRTLAPEATIFGREDIRWCGNEAGHTRDTEWNVIAAYKENPRTMSEYMDLYGDLGTSHVLLSKEKPYYLHYQPAETNTSIREGWFYRDDTHQRTRSADDVFDIYERSVGGNSIFLLNIPPTREGNFSHIDVAVLKETGKRISETYGHDLFEDVTMGGDGVGAVISAPKPVTFNRITIQEDIANSGERVEKHAVDAWIEGQWKEIAQATNIGYKRILRFPEVTTDKVRIRILATRLNPAIARISAHYYRKRPPLLNAERNPEGLVTIAARTSDFDWSNWNNTDAAKRRKPDNKNKEASNEYTIYYTTDGSEPNAESEKYTTPFAMTRGELKAIAYAGGEKGAVHYEHFGLIKKGWKQLVAGSGETALAIDLGKSEKLVGFAYTPLQQPAKNMVVEGVFQISADGKKWKDADSFKFGNLINDPTKRYLHFKKPVNARYVRILPGRIADNGSIECIDELDIL